MKIFSLPNPSICTMALGFTQPLMETSTRKSFWGIKHGRPAREADSLTAVCEPMVKKMWEPEYVRTL
jgi:hypothetical protein